MRGISWGLIALGCSAIFLTGCATINERQEEMPKIAISASTQGDWTARYTLSKPAVFLAFLHSPDDSRARAWKAPSEFVIRSGPDGETVQRRDGASFRSVLLKVPPQYRDLPKDYAPFAPFGDGGLLVHTGRFFACPDVCSGDPVWKFTLTTGSAMAILNRGEKAFGSTTWSDRGDGRYVYLGKTKPIETGGLKAIIDSDLPAEVGAQLNYDIPRFSEFYAKKLGDLEIRPTLFVSYDSHYASGWGRQGGTLPGQIFVHFYGSEWTDRMKRSDFADDLAWHLAHEVGHLYQRGITGDVAGASWIHEGAAEALAALAMARLGPSQQAFATDKVVRDRARCLKLTERQSLASALDQGEYEAAYVCGLTLGLALDHAVRRILPQSEGIFAVWRRFVQTAQERKLTETDAYFTAIGEEANRCVADAVHAAVADIKGLERLNLDAC